MKEKCNATGKTRFTTYGDAKIVLFFLKTAWKNRERITGRRIKHRQGRPLQQRIYYCQYCGGYHLTKVPAYLRKRAEKAPGIGTFRRVFAGSESTGT